jgi:tetratricopeptide (TPR) repeat protein
MNKCHSFKNKIVSIIIALFLSLNVFGINLKKFEDQLRFTLTLSVSGVQIEENNKRIIEICKELTNEYKNKQNIDALMFLMFFEIARKENGLNLNQKINNLLYVINKCDKKNVKLIAFANYVLSSLLIENTSGEIALGYSKNVLNLLKKNPDLQLEKLTYNQIGLINFEMKEFQTAKSNFTKAYKIDKNSSNFFLATMLSNVSACEYQTKKYIETETAIKEVIKLLSNAKSDKEQKYLAFIKGNLGSLYKKMNQNEISKENLWYEINYYCSRKLFLPFLNESFNDLLDFYLKEENPKKLNELVSIINTHGKNQIELTAIFDYKKLLLKYYNKIGNQEKTSIISEEIIDLQEKLKEDDQDKIKKVNSTFYSNKIDFINSTFNNEEIILNTELHQKRIINYSIISFTILISFSLLYVLKQRNLKLKNIQLINHQTTEIENAKRVIVEKELKLKKEMVSNLSIFLNLKTETEKAFLKNFKDLKRKKNQDIESVFGELQSSVIKLMNIDNTHLNILATIENENAEIIEKINTKFPILNKLECQLCSYFRLGLNSKEISLIVNLTPGTVRVYKVKIKQKLNLSEDQNLNLYLQEQDEFLI